MTIKAKLISVDSKSFKGKDGTQVNYSQVLCQFDDGVIVRLSANKDFDFKPFVFKDVDLDIMFTSDASLSPRIKVVGVIKK